MPSATLPDDIIMNRILYPAKAIAEGYHTLDRTPAPLGHPMLNGQYIPAREPEAINGYWVGAWNENVRRINGRVYVDKVIDVEAARQTKKGLSLLDAIYKQQPISTSTGLLLNLTASDHPDYDYVADSMEADHDAILIGETPAATPQQGVGIFVNAAGEKVDVQNAELTDDAMKSIAQEVAYQMESAERKTLVEKIVAKMREMFSQSGAESEGNAALLVNTKEGTDMELKELADKLEALTKVVANKLEKEDVDAAVKTVADQVATLAANVQAQQDAQKAELVAKVVNANILDEADAKELSVNALQKMAAKIKAPAAAVGLFGGFTANAADDDVSDELPGGDA